MPFYLMSKDRDCSAFEHLLYPDLPDDINALPSYPTRAEARDAVDPTTHRIVFLSSARERYAWIQRESDRFAVGEYRHIPWRGDLSDRDDYVHLSKADPAKVAYLKDAISAHEDRQSVLPIRKYLGRFYPDVDSDTVDSYCRIAAVTSYLVARTADEIERIYEQKIVNDNGSYSCMSHRASEFDSGIHPARVYGDSDLAVAYLLGMDDGKVIARTLIWDERKRYGRLYGKCADADALRHLLIQAGYSKGGLNGARVRYLTDDQDRHIMPYVDNISHCEIDGKWVVLGTGDIGCQETTGYASTAEPEYTYTCDNCGDGGYDDTYGGEGLCQSCWDDTHTTCDECSDTIMRDDATSFADGTTYCESCYADAHTTCAVCEDTWIEGDLRRAARMRRADTRLTEVCIDCEDTHHVCTGCDEWVETEQDENGNDLEQCADCRPAQPADDAPIPVFTAAQSATFAALPIGPAGLFVDGIRPAGAYLCDPVYGPAEPHACAPWCEHTRALQLGDNPLDWSSAQLADWRNRCILPERRIR